MTDTLKSSHVRQVVINLTNGGEIESITQRVVFEIKRDGGDVSSEASLPMTPEELGALFGAAARSAGEQQAMRRRLETLEIEESSRKASGR